MKYEGWGMKQPILDFRYSTNSLAPNDSYFLNNDAIAVNNGLSGGGVGDGQTLKIGWAINPYQDFVAA